MLNEEFLSLNLKDFETPEQIIRKTIIDLERVTGTLVTGFVEPYEGSIFSYARKRLSALASITASTIEERYDVQDYLGEQGDNISSTYKVVLKGTKLDDYSFALLFMKFGIGKYPITVVLDEDCAEELNMKHYLDHSGYIFKINNSKDFRDFLDYVFVTDRLIEIVQGIITATNLNEQKLSNNDDIANGNIEQ